LIIYYYFKTTIVKIIYFFSFCYLFFTQNLIARLEKIPKPLIDQLTDGGRMIIPVGEKRGMQKLVLLRKDKSEMTKKEVMDMLFAPMVKDEKLKV